MGSIEKNLVGGSVFKRLITFAVPFLIANIVQSLYSVADMLIVGNFSGTISMAGVNMGSQITFIETTIIVGFCMGGAVLIAQYIGANKQEEMKKTTSTLITLLLYLSVILTVLMLFLGDPFLRLLQTPEEAFAESSAYLLVTVIGTIFIFGYNALSAILRGMGDSQRPLIFVGIACVVNIGLDLLLVGVFRMGAVGAAIATVASQALSMILCIVYLKKRDFVFDFKPSSFKIDRASMKMIVKIGLPSAIQNGITNISFLIITALVNVLGGVAASAAVGVVSKFNGFAIMPALAMANSISTVAAQNIGANEWDRAKRTCRMGTVVAFVISALIFVLVQLFPEAILKLFDDDPQMIASGVEYMRSFSIDYLLTPFLFCYNGLFIAAGHTNFSLLNNALAAIILRTPMAILLGTTFALGMFGVGMAAPIATLGSLAMILWFYLSKRWTVNVVDKKTVAQKEAIN